MNLSRPIKIVASGKYLPQRVSATEMETKYQLTPGWIEKHTGIMNRHFVTFESNAFMGAKAIEKALDKAGMKLSEIDMIISAGATFDYTIPYQGSVTKSELADALITRVPAIDVNSSCLSFVNAFEIASKMLDGHQYKNILIVTSEIASKGLNTKDPETLTLFGDGAVAFILTYDDKSESAFIKAGMKTFSESVFETMVRAGGLAYFIRDYPYNEDFHSFSMNGIRLLKLIKREAPLFFHEFFTDSGYSLNDVDVFFPHQASTAGLTIIKNMIPEKADKIKENITEYGNCIAASIPLLLHDVIELGEVNRGDLCLMTGTSAGVSIGAVLFRY